MRHRVSTAIDERLLRQARRRAAGEGKSLGRVIEDALQHHLTQPPSVEERRKLVAEGWGVFHISPQELKEALKGDLFDT